MKTTNRPYLLFTVLALVAASTFALGAAFAGEAPVAKADPASAPATGKAEAPATKTTSPIHSMMGWVATHAVGDLDSPCPSCPKAEAAWRGWFDGGKDIPLAALRDHLVADGWTADRYIGYFQQMSKAHGKAGGECGDCDKECADRCDKDCSDCPSKGDCGDSSKDGASAGGCHGKGRGECCGGCGEKKDVESEKADTAAK